MGRGARAIAALAASLLLVGSARAEVSCAGEGPPLRAGEGGYLPASLRPVVPTALVTLAGVPWRGAGARAEEGAPISGGRLRLERARFGVCGHADAIAYRLVYEPWDAAERGRSDATTWGRFTDVQLAWAAKPWLVLALGIGKLPSGRGREQPLGALALPILPAPTLLLAPDRRFGFSLDGDLGVLRLALGLHAGARNFDIDRPGGLLVAARIELLPLGPVGHRPSAEFGAWTERLRAAFGITAQYRRARAGDTGYLLGTDVTIARRRWLMAAEVLYARNWLSEQAPPQVLPRALGIWAEGLVHLWRRRLSAAVRGEFLDEDLDRPGGFIGLSGGLTLATAGPLMQLQVYYTHRFHFTPRPTDGLALLSLTFQR